MKKRKTSSISARPPVTPVEIPANPDSIVRPESRFPIVGIVLSGIGSDGTLGVRVIKGEGGIVMEQTPESTEYDGMPRTAISTGLVGFVLPLAEMPAQLMAYVAHAFRKISRPISSQIPPKADDSHPGLEPGSGKDSMAGVKPRQWR